MVYRQRKTRERQKTGREKATRKKVDSSVRVTSQDSKNREYMRNRDDIRGKYTAALKRTSKQHIRHSETDRKDRNNTYHDNQGLCGGTECLERFGLVSGPLVVEGRPSDIKLARPVDGPGTVDVVVITL